MAVALRKIECPALGDSSCGKNLPNNSFYPFFVAVENRDFRAFVGKEMRSRSSHPAGGTGNECHLAGNGSAQFGQFCHRVILPSNEVLSSYGNLHSMESGGPLFPLQKSCHTELLLLLLLETA